MVLYRSSALLVGWPRYARIWWPVGLLTGGLGACISPRYDDGLGHRPNPAAGGTSEPSFALGGAEAGGGLGGQGVSIGGSSSDSSIGGTRASGGTGGTGNDTAGGGRLGAGGGSPFGGSATSSGGRWSTTGGGGAAGLSSFGGGAGAGGSVASGGGFGSSVGGAGVNPCSGLLLWCGVEAGCINPYTNSFHCGAAPGCGLEAQGGAVGEVCGSGRACVNAQCQNCWSLSAPKSIAVGGNPSAIAVGNIDADEYPDLVTANISTATVNVTYGDRTGAFTRTAQLTVGKQPRSVALGDVNKDKLLDIVVVHQGLLTSDGGHPIGSENVGVLLGKSVGGFETEATVTAGTNAYFVTLADVSGDGRLDIVVANHDSDDVSILLGRTSGGFDPQVSYRMGPARQTGVPVPEPFSVVVGDFDQSGSLDLVTSNYPDYVSVLLGKGKGVFGPYATYATDNYGVAIVAGDFDQDLKLDVVTAHSLSGNANWMKGKGDGSFGRTQSLEVGANPSGLAVGDLDADGLLDLVASTQSATATEEGLRVMLGKGDGSFWPPSAYPAGRKPTGIALGDFNQDTVLDVAVANMDSSNVSVFLGVLEASCAGRSAPSGK